MYSIYLHIVRILIPLKACDRNAVEGRNGNAKRRFGLDLIAAKLDETAKTEAALITMSSHRELNTA